MRIFININKLKYFCSNGQFTIITESTNRTYNIEIFNTINV